jgi:hypothetical protein
LQGIITAGFGALCFWILPAAPEKTRIFNEEERALCLARMRRNNMKSDDGDVVEATTIRGIFAALSPLTCICSLAYCLASISVQGLSLFMPTIISTLGHYTSVQSNLRTVPP